GRMTAGDMQDVANSGAVDAVDAGNPNRMARGAFEASLPRAAYVDETFLDREREAIWWSDWVVVGRVEQLPEPGDFLAVDVAGEQVIVARARRGGLTAPSDVCRHRGSRLTTPDQRPDPASGEAPGPSGRFKGIIRCPYHSWCYELDGRVRNAPFLGESDAFEPAEFGLHPVAVDAWGGWLFVNLSPERVAAGGEAAGPPPGHPAPRAARSPPGPPAAAAA